MAEAEKVQKESFIDVFIEGSKKGIQLWLYMLVPGTFFGYAAVQVFQVTGFLDLIGKIFAPIMSVFGLPGEAISVLFTTVLALPGGAAAAASLAADGILSGRQVTILFPMIFCLGNQVQFLGRVLTVSKVENRKFGIYIIIGLLCSVISGLFMNYIVLR